ncbi:hypothetical protein L1987_02959 [Smallanthus sonchifolius]|uniref:Uncharacterized protein n=1 Tax=Smallanthus sonchifolius TaxID=185202 RepID=A0ACB9K9F5_9ASTR|nr:hypothetical protein L1987_02959 [Smallanthus sonchifolius]
MESKTILISLLVAGTQGSSLRCRSYIWKAIMINMHVVTYAWQGSQLKVIYVGFEPVCEYPSSPAMGLAIAATVALVIALAIITSATAVVVRVAILSLTDPNFPISWITSITVVIMFLAGAKLSSLKGVEEDINGVYYCYTKVREELLHSEKSRGDLELKKPPVTDGRNIK